MKALFLLLKGLLFAATAFMLSYTQADAVSAIFDLNFSTTTKLVVSGISMFAGGGVGMLNIGIAKEIWIDTVMEGFYLVGEWLTRSVDLSPLVDNDKINLAEAGIDPEVLVNNTTYPIGIVDRADVPKDLELDYYDTKNTPVRNAVAKELAYDKLASVTRGHKNALREMFLKKVAHGWCPTTDSVFTPIIPTTGDDDGNTLKAMKLKDIRTLMNRFNTAGYGQNGRVLLLCSQHLADLLEEDEKLFKNFANFVEGSIARIYGFDVYVENATPTFNKSTGVKTAFAAAAAPTTDTHASIAWVESEVMRCDGSLDMFFQEKNPEHRADIIGFQTRKLGMPLRGKGMGAIYSPAYVAS